MTVFSIFNLIFPRKKVSKCFRENWWLSPTFFFQEKKRVGCLEHFFPRKNAILVQFCCISQLKITYPVKSWFRMEQVPVPIIVKTNHHTSKKPSLKALILNYECRIRFRCNCFFLSNWITPLQFLFSPVKNTKLSATFVFPRKNEWLSAAQFFQEKKQVSVPP